MPVETPVTFGRKTEEPSLSLHRPDINARKLLVGNTDSEERLV